MAARLRSGADLQHALHHPEGTKGIQARQTIFHQQDMPTHILLPVMPH
jgi:hypothetical protein